MTKIFYVELTRPTYFMQEVRAETPEEAQNAVLLAAGGNPTDWEIVRTDDVTCDKNHRDATSAE